MRAEKLKPGTKIKVKGIKTELNGFNSILNAVHELVKGEKYIAPPVDITCYIGTERLKTLQSYFVSLKGMIVDECYDSSASSENNNDFIRFKVSMANIGKKSEMSNLFTPFFATVL